MKRSTVFTLIECGGVVATALLSYRAANIMAKKTDSQSSTSELIKENWKVLIPPATAGVVTIASIIISHGLDKKTIKSLAAAAGGSGALLAKYKQKIKEKYGPDGYSKVLKEIAADELKKDPEIEERKKKIITYGMFNSSVFEIPADDDILFYDEWSNRWFRSNLPSLMAAVLHLNRNLNLRGFASVNELYELQELDGELDDTIGWSYQSLIEETEFGWIDISIYRGEAENEQCDEEFYVISYDSIPENYDEE